MKRTTDKNNEGTTKKVSPSEQEKARELTEDANPKEVFYNVDGKAVDEETFQHTQQDEKDTPGEDDK
jgi:hypothetical protein